MGDGIQSTGTGIWTLPEKGPTQQQEQQQEQQHEQQHEQQIVVRRTEDGTDSKSQLPHCEPLELTIPSDVPPQIHSSPQIVIAHRGASSHLPEHSLEGYRLALELGADYIEPDLVATKDHHLVAMHSLDLTVTTNVEDVFGLSRNKTLSSFKKEQLKQSADEGGAGPNVAAREDTDATGYWVYDFTLEELKQLRLKQRLGGPENNGRSKAFDGLFQIPTLTEILQLLNDWNENVQPLWYHDDESNTHIHPPPPRGLYAEFKDFHWLVKDADINLVDIFFDHIKDEKSMWANTLLKHMCYTKRLREHEYKLPPLVMQSFDAEVLKDFMIRWEELATNNNNQSNSTKFSLALTSEVPLDSSGGDNFVPIPLPTPPRILLVDQDMCLEEQFWFETEELYRDVITGIGPDKMCFFKIDEESSTVDAQTQARHPVFRYQPTVMEEARKRDWKVHPWTMRPEEAFFATATNEGRRRRAKQAEQMAFGTVLEELLFLKCIVGVDGVFSESVDVAVRAMGMACPDTKHSHGSSSSSGPNTALFDTNEIPMGPVIGFSFVSGILVALLGFQYVGGAGRRRSAATSSNGQHPRTRQAPRIPGRRRSNLGPHSAIPMDTANGDDDDVEMVDLDDNDREIL